jgi:hypothetical protein
MNDTPDKTAAPKRSRPWRGHILVMPEFKPGDLPPDGYLQWNEWAEVQRKAGIKQVECPSCGLWQTPQELSTNEVTWTVKNTDGTAIRRSGFECSKCFAKPGGTNDAR